jgi:hypothetical protein
VSWKKTPPPQYHTGFFPSLTSLFPTLLNAFGVTFPAPAEAAVAAVVFLPYKSGPFSPTFSHQDTTVQGLDHEGDERKKERKKEER